MDPLKGVLCTDFETASAVDIKVGAWAYSQHPSTKVFCTVWAYAEKPGDYEYIVWEPGDRLPKDCVDFIHGGGKVLAHNAGFEKSILTNILAPRFDWPVPDGQQWDDTQARGHAVNMPSSLDGLAHTLGCPTQKDKDGAKIMKAMAKAKPDDEGGWLYHDDPDDLERLIEYCCRDVGATLDCHFRLPALSVSERLLWLADQRINERGVYLDQEFAGKCAEIVQQRAAELDEETFSASRFYLSNTTNPAALKKFLKLQGVKLPKVTKKNSKGKMVTTETCDANAVAKLLDDPELPDVARAVLDIRTEAGKVTSLKKLDRVPTMVGFDGRLRYALQYCKAHTGRWASSGLQVHNLPKVKMGPAEQELVRWCIKNGRADCFDLFSVHSPLHLISQNLRSILAAPKGFELLAADYSAIEARVVAWLAGQKDVLELFHNGEDVYVAAARKIGSTSRDLGKLATLSLGYGMGALALNVQGTRNGIVMTLKQSAKIQKAWRKSNEQIVAFWHQLEWQAKEAIAHPGKSFPVGKLLLYVKHGCLFIRLPSGRCLRYWKPCVTTVLKRFKVVNDDGVIETREVESDEIRFLTPNKGQSGMAWESTYGGKLAENVTQAVARDLLGFSILEVDRVAPYEPVVHVHDSLAAQVPEGGGDLEEFCGLLKKTPKWARTLPMKVEGYRGAFFAG